MMAVRLLEMRRLLKPTGSLYLHCDPTAGHYLKTLMDSVFGAGRFQNEIIWHYRRWTGKATRFQRLHDLIYFYSKSDYHCFNQLYTEYTKGSKQRKEQGVLHRFKAGESPHLVSDKEVSEKGVPENDVWQIPFVAPSAKERVGYPTQKPLALLDRIIKASSNAGDVVLDPFAGCATACVSAETLGRKWIGIDLSQFPVPLWLSFYYGNDEPLVKTTLNLSPLEDDLFLASTLDSAPARNFANGFFYGTIEPFGHPGEVVFCHAVSSLY